MDRRIGAQYYTLRDYIKNIEDFDSTCKKIAEIGYQIIQISASPLLAQEMRTVTDKYNLKTVVTHKGFSDFVTNVEDVIEYNRLLDSDFCGIGCMPFEYTENIETLSDFIQKTNQAAEKIKAAGMTLVYHNHAFEFAKIDGKTIMDWILEETDPENVQFIVDTYWVQYGGANPADFIRKVGKRAALVHFKDFAIDQKEINRQKMAEVGQGNLDWDSIIKTCDESGTKWALVEQDICERDPFDSMKMSYDFLKTKGFY
ncbi:MAG: sugar phosphate isomerase/epimerase family protein [Oliverpabstia sp.]